MLPPGRPPSSVPLNPLATRKPVKKVCIVCGCEFEAAHSTQVICSKQCWAKHTAERAKRERHDKALYEGKPMYFRLCKQCGKEFETLSRYKNFCSMDCMHAYRAAQRGGEPVQGEEELPPHNKKAGGVYKQWHCHDCGKPCDTYRCPECQRKWLVKNGYSKASAEEIMHMQQETAPRSESPANTENASKKKNRKRLNFAFYQGGI